MTHYILIATLLSLIGGLFYFGWFQKRLDVLQAKVTLLVIIALSWTIPILVPTIPEYTKTLEKEYLFDYNAYTAWNVVDIKDDALVDCYEQAKSSADQCQCEIEQQSNIIRYQNNPYYNVIIASKQPVYWFFVVMMVLLALDLLVKVGVLLLLVLGSHRQKREIEGVTFYLLRPTFEWPIAISSFTLWNHYILMQEGYEDHFSEEELQHILLHEVAHLRQYDTWWQLGMYVLRLFWWMQPMFYWFKKELDALNEYVADDFAAAQVKQPKAYAKTLIKAKELQLHQRKPSFALAFAKSLFKRRILRLVKGKKAQQPWKAWLALPLILLLFWNTTAVALPLLQRQDIAIRQYEVLQQKNQTTGEVAFCKSCLVSELLETDE